MLTYLLILFIVALAVAPLAHFLPSKRQRAVARMREYAAVHGLFVEFRDTPVRAGEPRSSGQVIYYGKRLPASLATPVTSTAWAKTREGWRCVGGRVQTPAPVEALAVEILAASVDPSSCGVYWNETAGEEAVEQIRQALERWSELIAR